MTLDTFKSLVTSVEGRPGYQRPAAFALGIASYAIGERRPDQGTRILDTFYPVVNREENFGACAMLAEITGWKGGPATFELSADQLGAALAHFAPFIGDGHRHANIDVLQELTQLCDIDVGHGIAIPRRAVVTFVPDLQAKAHDTHDAYLRLQLLSQRKAKPNTLNLDGLFGLLNNVVWTDKGPFDLESFERIRLHLKVRGTELRVFAIDKFPRMADYVIPSGVRLADADRARLGAHLAEGTTVMHEGFCNFNAGTLGKSMVEGRISQGVVVGNGSDIGGGASIMGTLSGGGKTVISIGENSLLGANCGLGIPLGANCTVEAGLYLTAGSKVRLLPEGQVVKAAELAGKDDLLFRRNSLNGAIEVQQKKGGGWQGLNSALHANT